LAFFFGYVFSIESLYYIAARNGEDLVEEYNDNTPLLKESSQTETAPITTPVAHSQSLRASLGIPAPSSQTRSVSPHKSASTPIRHKRVLSRSYSEFAGPGIGTIVNKGGKGQKTRAMQQALYFQHLQQQQLQQLHQQDERQEQQDV